MLVVPEIIFLFHPLLQRQHPVILRWKLDEFLGRNLEFFRRIRTHTLMLIVIADLRCLV